MTEFEEDLANRMKSDDFQSLSEKPQHTGCKAIVIKFLDIRASAKEYVRSLEIPPIIYVVFFGFAMTMIYANFYTIAGSLPHIESSFGVSHASIGIMVLCMGILSIGSSIFASAFISEASNLSVIVWSQLFCVVSCAVSSMSSTFVEFAWAQCLFAVAEGGFMTVILPYIKQQSTRKDYRSTSVLFAATAVGSSLGYLCGALAELYSGWRVVFAVYALIFLCLSFVMIFIPSDEPPTSAVLQEYEYGYVGQDDPLERGLASLKQRTVFSVVSDPKQQLLPLFKNPALIWGMCGDVLRNTAITSTAFWLPVYAVNAYGMCLFEIDILMSVYCGLLGTAATLGVAQIFQLHLDQREKMKTLDNFQGYAPGANLMESLEAKWFLYLKNRQAYHYVVGFMLLTLFASLTLPFIGSQMLFTIALGVQIFCVFSILTPLSNILLDITPQPQHQTVSALQFCLHRVCSQFLVIPLIGAIKEYVGSLGLLLMVIVLLAGSVGCFIQSYSVYIKNSFK